MKRAGEAHFLGKLHLQTPNVFFFFLFPNLKSSDPNDSDSGDITWRQFSGLHTAPLERHEALCMVLYTVLNCPTPRQQKAELKCSHVALTASRPLQWGGGVMWSHRFVLPDSSVV